MIYNIYGIIATDTWDVGEMHCIAQMKHEDKAVPCPYVREVVFRDHYPILYDYIIHNGKELNPYKRKNDEFYIWL